MSPRAAQTVYPQHVLSDDDIGGKLVLPERNVTPGKQFALRAAIALACIIITTAVVYFGRNGYRDITETPLTLLDALYYATVSLSTTGYGDITPVTADARVANILIVTPLRLLFLIVLVGTTIEVLTQRTRAESREKSWRKRVQHHSVVIGYGVKGRAAVSTLLQAGERADRIVVISQDRHAVEEASRQGVFSVFGDARREDVLKQAMVERASKVIVATDADDTTVLITLSVHRLNSGATIVAAARESSNADLIRASGATSVVPTAESAGQLMGLASVAPEAGTLMEDLLDPGKGLEVTQRPVTRDEIGMDIGALRSQGQIVLAVVRDGQTIRFDEGGVKVFQRGDQLVVIRKCPPGRMPADS